ncbi:hypothetical protein [Bacillus sp. 2205SS5-2]|uniref:hypothetical protein n=1 Tax=Bacillus sp. 2205SS5-2 TaxID=3109031 RepID=UPI003003A7DB
MSIKDHQCEEMNLAIKELRNGDKLEISKIDGSPYMEVTTEIYDSSYGEGEESIFIPIKFCPFCGNSLVK